MNKILLAAVLSAFGLGSAQAAVWQSTNPFASRSALPYYLPAFDKIHDADYSPAFEAGMKEQLEEVEAIARDPESATFDNTVLALEKSGRLLGRVSQVFYGLNSSNTNDAMQKIEADLAPRLAAHSDAILLDPAVYARYDDLYKRRAALGLDPESLQLLERGHFNFVRAGAALSEKDKKEVKGRKEGAVVVEKKEDLFHDFYGGEPEIGPLLEYRGLSAPKPVPVKKKV